MTKKNKTVKELNIEFELLSERVKNLESKDSTTSISKEKVDGIEEIIKQYDDKIKHLDQLLNVAKKRETSDECESISGFKCNECGNCFERQPDLKEHKKKNHQRVYRCNRCEETFLESWMMEKHLKTHGNAKVFKCNICEREFYTSWRLGKHVTGHTGKVKFCHYFNNGKKCPYYELGCQFKHEDSEKCKFDKRCHFKLCQFKHTASSEKISAFFHQNILV